MNNYLKYRGTCKEAVQALCADDPTLKPVRGFYHCWSMGKQQHWWAVDNVGNIVDPTIAQFPSPHIGEYEEFDGTIECEQCGKVVKEEEATMAGRYAVCSHTCYGKLVGVL